MALSDKLAVIAKRHPANINSLTKNRKYFETTGDNFGLWVSMNN